MSLKVFRMSMVNGTRIEVHWTPEGLDVWLDGKKHPSEDMPISDVVEYSGVTEDKP